MVRTWIRGGKVLANVYPVDLVHSTKVFRQLMREVFAINMNLTTR